MKKRLLQILSTITWVMGCSYLKPWAFRGTREESRAPRDDDDSALWLIHETELLEQSRS